MWNSIVSVPDRFRFIYFEFYIDDVTREILQKPVKFPYHCNVSPGERKASPDISHVECNIIKMVDKFLSVVMMNHADYIDEVER